MANWFQNGRPLTTVAIDDRGYQYGDGLFETVAIRAAEPRLWSYHVDRLQLGCERLNIVAPDRDVLLEQLRGALLQSDVPEQYCVAKIMLSAGGGRRGYGRALVTDPALMIGIFPTTAPQIIQYREGIATTLCRTRLASNSATAGLKTMNRIEQVLARSEFSTAEFFEGFTMDADNHVICGTMSNVFFVIDNIVHTPALQSCGVSGVMRRHIIVTLGEHGLDVCQQDLRMDALADVDEIFVANSQFGVLPVSRCDDITWPAGNVTRNVMAMLSDTGIVECRS